MSRIESLYIHVPFCAHKCEYCAFYSHAPNGEVVNRYVAALIREMEMVAHDLNPGTIFFGGGTPSLLNLSQWETIFKSMDHLGLLGAAEWTVECNPATVSLDKAKLLRDWGVNRISMGVQSLNENLLERLGRIHSREMVFRSYEILRKAGFENVNVDLMFAIPGQTMEVWKETLREAAALKTEHLSCYEVIYEEDTPLFHQLRAGEFTVDEDLASSMHEELVASAVQSGFVQYEIANFARDINPKDKFVPSQACRHNLNYWKGGSYHGLGPSAAEYVNGVRTKNWSNTTLYCEQIEQGGRPIESRDILSPLARAGEVAAFGLRRNSGWDFREFRDATGFDLETGWDQEIRSLVQRGWGELKPGRFHLTANGLRFADSVAEDFLR